MKTTMIYEMTLGDVLETYTVLSGASEGKLYIDGEEIKGELLKKEIKIVVILESETKKEINLFNGNDLLSDGSAKGSAFKITKKKENDNKGYW